MDWLKAKQVIIIGLVVLNIMLLSMRVPDMLSYSITSERIADITELLRRNAILLEPTLPRTYKPKQMIGMEKSETDTEQLRKLFFLDAGDFRRSFDLNKTVLRNSYETLIIDGVLISYSNTEGTGALKSMASDDVAEYVNEYLRKLGYGYPNFNLDTIEYSSETHKYTLIYYETFKRSLLLVNNVNVTVSSKGIERLDVTRYKPIGFVDAPRDIVAPDAALLSLLHVMKAESKSTAQTVITKMDVVYGLEQEAHTSARMLKAAPYYRVFVKDRTNPYLINAYTNEISNISLCSIFNYI